MLLLLVTSTPLRADGLSLGLRGGTNGLGLEAAQAVRSNLNVRAGFALLGVGGTIDARFSRAGLSADVSLDTRFRLRSFQMLVDLHPSHDYFRVTGGLFFNKNRLTFAAHDAKFVQVNDEIYPIEGFAAEIRLGRAVAPYVGIGFGNSTSPDRRVTAVCDVGFFFQGSSSATLATSGEYDDATKLIQDLEASQARFNAEYLTKAYLKFYPVISVGIAVRVF
jgi:hypothetical protein